METNEIEIKEVESKDIENKKEESKKVNILKQYEDLSPIDLVDTFERYYHTFLPSFDKDSLRTLSSYKSKPTLNSNFYFLIQRKIYHIH